MRRGKGGKGGKGGGSTPTPATDDVAQLKRDLASTRQQLDKKTVEHNAKLKELRAKQEELKQALKRTVEAEKAEKTAKADAARYQEQAKAAKTAAEAAKARYDERLRALIDNVDDWIATERSKRSAALDKELAQRRAEADKAVDDLRAEADAALRVARQAANAERATARDEADQLRATAHEDAARVQATATVAAREREAEAARHLAEAERQAANTEHTARQVLEATQREAREMLAERTRALDVREYDLDERDHAQQDAQRVLDRGASERAHRQRQLDQLSAFLDKEQARLDDDRAALRLREAALDPSRLEQLESEVRALNARLTEAREAHRQAAADAEQLEARLAHAEADGGGHLGEVQRLRRENRELKDALDARPSLEEVERARADQSEADGLRQHFSGQAQRIQELEAAERDHRIVLDRARRETEDERRRHLDTRRELEAAHARQTQELEIMRGELEELRDQALRFEIGLRDQAAQQVQYEAEAVRSAELQRQLDSLTEANKHAVEDHFGRLAKMDRKPPPSGLNQPTDPPALDELARRIRAHLANGVGAKQQRLYYSQHTIRAFLAGLACADLTLLQGPSGTGKTSLPIAVGEALGAHVVRIPVQAGWRDRADLLGYYNAFTRSFRGTTFTETVYRAGAPDFADRPVFIVLDECNLSQMEYYFADLLSELEDWSVQVPTIRLYDEQLKTSAPERLVDENQLPLLRNIRYFGTANQDESTHGIADKTYDRAAVMLLEKRATPEALTAPRLRPVSWTGLVDRFDEAQRIGYPEDEVSLLIEGIEPVYMEEFGFGLGNRFEERIVSRFLPVYAQAGGDPADGLDHLLRTRIVRRLDRIRDPGRLKGLRRLRDALDESWPWTHASPERSSEALERIIERVQR